MIKINLLPARVAEARKVRSLMRLLVLVVLIEIAGLSFGVFRLVQIEKQRQNQYEDAHARAEQVRGLEKKTQQENTAAAPFRAAMDWNTSLYAHSSKISDTLEKINEYVFEKLTVRSIQVNGAAVQLSGATKDIDHVARAYFNLLRSPYISTASIALNPGGGSGRGGARGAPGGGGFRGGPPGMGGGGFPRGGGAPRGGGLTSAARRTNAANPNEAMGVQFSFALLSQYGIGGASSGTGAARGGRPAGGGGMMGGAGLGGGRPGRGRGR